MLLVKIKNHNKQDRKKIIKKLKMNGKIVEGSDETDVFILKNNSTGDLEISFNLSFDVNDDVAYEIINYLSKVLEKN